MARSPQHSRYRRFPERLVTIDHVIPLSKGGTWDHANLVLACARCNHAKGNKLPSELDLTGILT